MSSMELNDVNSFIGSDTSLNGDLSRDDLSDEAKSPDCSTTNGAVSPVLGHTPRSLPTSLPPQHHLGHDMGQHQFPPIKQEPHSHIALVNS